MEFGLKENTIEQINSVFEKFSQVDEVVIYGSRAKGNYREGSDIDFTLKGKNLNHKLLNSISLELDENCFFRTLLIFRFLVKSAIMI